MAEAIVVQPDVTFIESLIASGGADLKKCFQCATCTAVCALSDDTFAFPRKQMIKAQWGLRESLLADPSIWLCHNCGDCTAQCPRGAKPGDVLAAVRQEWVAYQAFPRFLARWANQPQSTPLLLGIMAALLCLALCLKVPAANALGISDQMSPRIVFPYSSMLPRWLLNSFFLVLGVLVLLPLLRGIARLWQATKTGAAQSGLGAPRNLISSVASALKSIVSHEKFALCTKSRPRYWSHLAVFFGFLALGLVACWVITAPYNPLIRRPFVYPFSFWSPWKLLANAGGISLVAGCLLMIRDRLKNSEESGLSNFSDWSLISALLAAAITGFLTEVLHYLRLEPHRQLAYFVHLVFAGSLLVYMPYSKFAHIIYRTVALISAERYNRTGRTRPDGSRSESIRGDTDLKYADAGQAKLAVIIAALVLVLVPLAYSTVSRVIPKRTDPPAVFLERPDPKYKNCVRETVYMRYHHWELLKGIREEVVRYGVRSDISLSKCRQCHTSRERFCDRCHNAVSMTPDCFGCHYYP
jgi:quinone-modifying oxidoreductase, subunit QmoC